jgi:putative transposase
MECGSARLKSCPVTRLSISDPWRRLDDRIRNRLCRLGNGFASFWSFVTGHGLSRAAGCAERVGALAPAMARPSRNSASESILNPARTFFATTKSAMGKRLLQSERNAGLLIDVLRSLVAEKKFDLHDFVVMPDHLHLLMTVGEDMTIEKAMQLVKGRFSFRLKKEFGFSGEVWQRGFSELQVMDEGSFAAHRAYIAENPVKAGLVERAEDYPFCYGSLARKKLESERRG